MNSKPLRRPVSPLAIGALLAVAGCLGAVSGRMTDSGADYGASGTEQENATSAEAGQRPARRLRASLSMPYFSFAQVLRPRS